MLKKRRDQEYFQEEISQYQPIKKIQLPQGISIQSAMQAEDDKIVTKLMSNLDENELEGIQDYQKFNQICEQIKISQNGVAQSNIIQSLSQLLCCKISDKHLNVNAKVLLLRQLASLVELMSPANCLLICDLILKKRNVYDEQVVRVLYQLMQTAYSENKQRVIYLFRLLNTKILAGMGNNLQKLVFTTTLIDTNQQDSFLTSKNEFIQEILMIDSVLSKQLINMLFESQLLIFKSMNSSIMTYKTQLTIKNMIYFIKQLNHTLDTNVEPIIFWFLCQQANSLNMKIRQVSFKGLSKVQYLNEEDLLSLISKEKGTEGLFHVRESNWIKQDNHWYSLTGLLIYALEDEYSSIRKYAIQCLKNFGKQSPIFSRECRDMLFYMMNDENDEVRILAINALKEIYLPFIINKSDLEIIIFNLKEKKLELRLALYSLISQSLTDSQQTLLVLIESVCSNLQKFKEDFNFLCITFRDFSLTNKKLIQDNISIILADRMNQEVDWFREDHILKIIIIKNALNVNISNEELPFYFMKHVDYLMDKYPNYFAKIEHFYFVDADLLDWIRLKELQNYDLSTGQLKCLKYFKNLKNGPKFYFNNFLKMRNIFSKFKVVLSYQKQISDDSQLQKMQKKNMLGMILLYQNQINDDQFESFNFMRMISYCNNFIKGCKEFEEIRLLLENMINNPKLLSSVLERCDFYNKITLYLQSVDVTLSLSAKDVEQTLQEKHFEIIKMQDKITFSNQYSTSFKLMAHLKGIETQKQHMIQIQYPGGPPEYHKLCLSDIKTLDSENSILDTIINLRQIKGTTPFSIKISLVNDLNDNLIECLPSQITNNSLNRIKIVKIPKIGKSQTAHIDFKTQL